MTLISAAYQYDGRMNQRIRLTSVTRAGVTTVETADGCREHPFPPRRMVGMGMEAKS